jgi:hypothetical protein
LTDPTLQKSRLQATQTAEALNKASHAKLFSGLSHHEKVFNGKPQATVFAKLADGTQK